jgi:hypothetical protein
LNAGTKYAKELSQYLFLAADAATLRALGWWDFFPHGVPDTDDCRVVAVPAASCLLFGESGMPKNYEPRVLCAILAFCKAKAGGSRLRETELEDQFIMLGGPSRRCEAEVLERWFRATFDEPLPQADRARWSRSLPARANIR